MSNKEILMGFKSLFLGALLALGYSCATQKEFGKNARELTLVLTNLTPYCGGAAPTPDMEIPRRVPMENTSFLLYLENDDGSRGKELREIKTNAEGGSSIFLPNGNYQLWLPTKKHSLEDFIKAESPDRGGFYSYKDKECFQAWREKADFKFDVKSDSTIHLSQSVRCYTDAHPCLKYDGPYRP